jgi:putative transposase
MEYITHMPRIARIVIPGVPHHVTQRGNNGQDVFFVEDDRLVYLELLRLQSSRYGFRIEGYCLMTNHVHLIGVPSSESSLALAVGRTNFVYSQYVNKLHGRTGHVWQNRFYSCAMDDAHAMNALCYIELNPVRAGMVKKAWDFQWSSAATHCSIAPHNPLLHSAEPSPSVSPKHWQETLKIIAKDKASMDTIRRNTHTGRPLGSDRFISKIEHVLGRRVTPLPVGRPKGWRKESPNGAGK